MRQPFVHEMFEEVVHRCPSRPALMSKDRSLTYTELDGWSNNIAHYLLERGATKGSFIHIVCESSFSVIASMIAVLKIGGIFVPMDPRQPEHRLRALAAQVPPNQVLTEAAIQAKVTPWFGDRVSVIPVDLESPNGTPRLLPKRDAASFEDVRPAPASISEPDDMCYIYFTSGSTGKPKAIAGRLKSIDHFVRWEISTFNVFPGTVVAQLTQPVFDAFLRDTFTPLCAGGTILIPENRDVLLNPERLGKWIADAKIELLHLVPSLFRTLLNANLTSASFPDLRNVLLSGEPLLPADVQKWIKIFDQGIRLVNLYGPTETTMVKLFHVVGREDTSRSRIPIGKPIPGAEVLLLDEKGKAAAPGTTGDIYIRTPYRTLGYYGNRELTDAVFVRNPLNNDPADVIYRTGDIGRFLADGSLEFLGRKDQQVKVRGIRVELDEIENALLATGLAREAAMTSREDRNGNTALCAYVVLSTSALIEQVRHAIATTLPEYMVPSFFVAMERLPRTSTGKIDRKSLPTPESVRENNSSRTSLVLSETQQAISKIFSEVLGIEQIGLDESFFHIGGHSLSAILVISRLRRTFQIDLPLRSLFEMPTVARLADKIEVANCGRVPELPLGRMAREGVVGLSFAQQRLWFLDQLQPGNNAFNILAAVRIDGPLDITILEHCLNEIVGRHEVLRTCFVMQEGQPQQQVLPAQPATLEVVDLGWVATSEQAVEVEGLLQEQARRPFHLECGPLFRPQLIRVGSREHVLALNMHHIVSDDWSLNVLVRELATLYEARVKRQPSPLPAPPIQYADFALWQRQWLQGEVLKQQLSYWRKELADLPVLELPLDFPRPALQTARGNRITRRLQGDLIMQVHRLSRSHDVTLFMSLLAVFELLLLRYSGAENLAVGTPVANRNREEIEGLIGFFVNTLVLRADLHGNPPFTELLKRVRETALGAYAHPDLPFEKLVEELNPERQLSHTPLFQVMFALQNAPVPEVQFADLRLTPIDTPTHAVKYDLRMTAEEVSPNELVLHVDYSTELFTAATIERMLEHFQNLLQSVVKNPTARLSELAMMGEAERRQILEGWNATRRDYGVLPWVHEMVERQVKRAPQAIALEYEQETLGYAELNRRANQLAHHLRRLGVGPEVRVALFLDRGLEMVVALLGVLKAGGTYVPLDPEYPAERLAFVASDAQVSVLLTQSRLRGRLPEVKAEIVIIDTDWEQIATQNGENPAVRVEAGNAAYILYTSGSTGRPKGVVITHAALTNFLFAMSTIFGSAAAGKWIAVTSICFDISVLELFWTLANGDHVIVHPGLTRAARAEKDSNAKRESDESWDYSGKDLQCTPSFATGLMEQWKTQPHKPRLRKVLVGGEAPTESLVRDLMSVAEDGIYNMYGPTETTVWSSVHRVTTVTGGVPIGKPIANSQMYVLDQQMEPVPAGVPGELYIGGAGLARGYWQRSELTAERFVPNPFSATAGDRLYRTGDRVKWRMDGALDFLGRVDSQVKLRGFRIELGEIEGALAQHRLVKEAAVIVRAYNNDKSLVAFVVCPPEAAISGNELRRYLRNRLPEYMVPSTIVILERMPLTPNGKLDRKGLFALESKATLDAKISAASGSELEQKIAAVWQEVLHIAKVHLDDNFFDLGGHSLLVVQVWSKLRGILEQELALIDLFTYPSVRSLARYLDQNQKAADDDSVPDRVRRRKEYFSRQRKNLQRKTIQ